MAGAGRSPSFQSGARRRSPIPALFLAVALLLAPWPDRRRPQGLAGRHQAPPLLAAAQGLESTADQLAASEAATASEFDAFEDALSLSAQTSGGRARGSRGGTGKGTFTDADKLLRLQLGMYYIGGSPDAFPTCRFKDDSSRDPRAPIMPRRPNCNNFVPRPRDQKDCSTCVADATATALQMSVAATLQQPVEDWEVSAPSLYYCSKGGRTCKTGWDIQEALNFLLDEEPMIVRPASCLVNVSVLNSADAQASISQWKPVCDNAQQAMAACPRTNPSSGLSLNCSYKSLGSFWEMQRHIRRHGAVITRIRIPDDFEVQFGANASLYGGEELLPYRFNASARGLFGHAALIVGYNNTERTWTVLNSWGDSSTRPNRPGVTADGLYRIQMGLLAIGTPDVTYGVECEPAAGSQWFQEELDPHQTRPWEVAKPVEVAPGADPQDLDAPCYLYRFNNSMDSVSSIVDHFGLDMAAFVRDNKDLFPDQTVVYPFVGRLTPSELQLVLDASQKALGGGSVSPFVRCTFYGPPGSQEQEVTLNCTTDAADCMRLGVNGTTGCTLVYSAANVSAALNNTMPLRICNISRPDDPGTFYRTARFDNVKASQLRALREILRALGEEDAAVPEDYCHWDVSPMASLIVWPCDSWVTGITVQEPQVNKLATKSTLTTISEVLLQPLLRLERLERLMLKWFDGPLPPQLGALQHITSLDISYFCAWGGLPANWLDGLGSIQHLSVGPYSWGSTSAPRQFAGHDCGVNGTVPERWTDAVGSPSLMWLDLSSNLLSGELPPLTGMSALQFLDLSGNWLNSTLPRSWAKELRSLQGLYLPDNTHLVGLVPHEWSSMKTLDTLNIDNTGLSGCLPLEFEAEVDYVSYYITNITGYCSLTAPKREGLVRSQAKAMAPIFTKLFDRHARWRSVVSAAGYFANTSDWYGDMVDWAAEGNLYRQRDITFRDTKNPFVTVNIGLQWNVDDGAVYVVDVEVRGATLDLTHLSDFVSKLPGLKELRIIEGTEAMGKSATRLPDDLAQRARQQLKVLSITGDVTGTLPAEWGSWTTLRELSLGDNKLSGSLPPSWGQMQSLQRLDLWANNLAGPLPREWQGMRSLGILDLSFNYGLSGSLPNAWAGRSGMPDGLTFDLSYTGLTGTIPPSYKRFGRMDLGGTRITGCVPPGVNATGLPLEACSISERQAVEQLRELLLAAYGNFSVLDGWLMPSKDDTAHCRNKTGIQCDASGRVTKVDLPALRLEAALPGQLNTASLFAILSGLPYLQTLVASKMRLAGPLPALPTALPGGNGTSLGKLRVLDLSGNPEITGGLPPSWQALQDLQLVDLSGCSGVTGTLPEGWAGLQSLQMLRAADTGVNGELPPLYGLLASLQELDVSNARLSGPPVPPAWLDVLQMQAAVVASGLQAAQSLLEAQTAAASASAVGQAGGPAAATSGEQRVALTRLKVLRLANNHFSGTLEPGLSRLPALRVLDVSAVKGKGNITGVLPTGLGFASKLQELSLSGQRLSGGLPLQWSMLSKITKLDLARNQLSGTLPPTWTGMKKLRRLDISGNTGLIGQVPSSWLQLNWCSKVLLNGTGVAGC